MIFNNQKISSSQFFQMMLLNIISISLMIIPKVTASTAGKDGVFSILLGAVFALIYSLILLFLSKNSTQEYFSSISKQAGRFISFLFNLLYLSKFFIALIFAIHLFTNIISETLLPNTDTRIIVLTLIITALYIASKKLEVRMRLFELLYYIILIPLIFFFLLGVPKINISNLLPLLTSSSGSILKTSISVFLMFSPMEFLLFTKAQVDVKDQRVLIKKLIRTILLITTIHLLIFVVVIGTLGTNGAGQKIWSTITVLQMLSVPGGFIQRLDGIVLAFWLISIFSILSSLLHYAETTIVVLISKKLYRRGFLAVFALILYLCSLYPMKPESLMNYFSKYLLFIGIPLSVFLPLLIKLFTRNKKEEHS
jgi:spore germination protein (amino acid permease)